MTNAVSEAANCVELWKVASQALRNAEIARHIE